MCAKLFSWNHNELSKFGFNSKLLTYFWLETPVISGNDNSKRTKNTRKSHRKLILFGVFWIEFWRWTFFFSFFGKKFLNQLNSFFQIGNGNASFALLIPLMRAQIFSWNHKELFNNTTFGFNSKLLTYFWLETPVISGNDNSKRTCSWLSTT